MLRTPQVALSIIGTPVYRHQSQEYNARRVAASSFETIAGYNPRSQVKDYAAIDLDQKVLLERLDLEEFAHARHVYERGGYSNPIAVLNLVDPMGPRTFFKGTRVYGRSQEGNVEVIGMLNQTVSWGTGTGENQTIYVEYLVGEMDSDDNYDCHVGGMVSFDGADMEGCKCICIHVRL
jgi:hypothetical protein